MRNYILLAFFALLFMGNVQAQGVKFGVKAGINTTQVSPDQLLVKDKAGADALSLSVKNAEMGYHGGLFVRFETRSKLFFQTELYASTTTVNYDFNNLLSSNAFQDIAQEKYYDLNMPIMAGLKFGADKLNFRVQGGVDLSKHIGGKTELEDISSDYSESFKGIGVGWQAGIGLDLWKFTVDLRYAGDFSKHGEHMQFFGESVAFDDREGSMLLSVGFKF